MLRLQYHAAQLRDALVLRPGGLDPPSGFTFFTRVVVAMWSACGWSQLLITMNLNRSPMTNALSKLCKRCASESQHHRLPQSITRAHKWQERIEMKVGSSASESIQLVVMHAFVIC